MMDEVAEAARKAIEHERGVKLKFSQFAAPCRGGTHLVPNWRWVTTDCQNVVLFFLACWNNRHALAALAQRDAPPC